MVGEFPELQGLMGRYYAALQGEHPSVAARHRGALQAARPVRPRADRPGLGRRGAGRQDRHAGGLRAIDETGTHEHGPSISADDNVHGSGRRFAPLPRMTNGDAGAQDEATLRAVADAIRDHYKPKARQFRPTEPARRSRSPTSSTRSSASGPSTRSRRDQGSVCAAKGGAGSDPHRALAVLRLNLRPIITAKHIISASEA